MNIAVISDLHDNVRAWERISTFLAEQSIETLLNCGDTAAPAMLVEISKTFSGKIHTIFGNVLDRELETAKARELANVMHHGDEAKIEIAGIHIYLTHFPDIAEREARRGKYDLVCHGHNHLKRWEKIGETFILNPGTAGGMFQYPTFAVVDLATMTCNFENVTL